MTVKSFRGTPVNGVPLKLYTVPANKVAIIKSLVATPDVFPPGDTKVNVSVNNSQLVTNAVVAETINTKLIDGFMSLNAADELWVENNTPAATRICNKTKLPGNITALLANEAGNVFCALVAGAGVYRSLDDCVTWTKVHDGGFSVGSWATFGSLMFFYLTDGQTLTSTDNGASWTLNTYANSPKSASLQGIYGRIAKNAAGTGVGQVNGTTVSYSSNGTSWTTVVLPQAPNSLIWAANFWIAAFSVAPWLVYSATIDSGSWQNCTGMPSAAIVSLSGNRNGSNLPNGTIVAIATASSVSVANSGATAFTQVTGLALGGVTLGLFLADYLLIGGTTNESVSFVKTPFGGNATAGSVKMHTLTANSFVKNNKIYGTYASHVYKSNSLDILNERIYGADFHLSVAEVDV